MSIASVLESLRREYAPTLIAEIGKLEHAARAENWAETRRIAHRLAGTAGSYGFTEASVAARAIEDAIDAGDAVTPALTALRELSAKLAGT